MKRAKPIAPADTKAAQLAADIADKAVRESGRVRLNFRRGDQWCVLHFPQGTDLWTILGRVR